MHNHKFHGLIPQKNKILTKRAVQFRVIQGMAAEFDYHPGFICIHFNCLHWVKKHTTDTVSRNQHGIAV